MDNKTTDNFSEPMYATKESTLALFTDEELKKELDNRGYEPVWMQKEENMIDVDLGPGY